MMNKALEAFKRIETSLRSHLQDTWHSTCKAEDDLNLVRAAINLHARNVPHHLRQAFEERAARALIEHGGNNVVRKY